MVKLRVVIAVVAAGAASANLPAVLRDARPCIKSAKVLAQLRTFFNEDGPGGAFRIGLDTRCVEGAGALGPPSARRWRKPLRDDLYDPKWGLESSLPLLVARSRWFAGNGPANATLAVFRPRARPRSDLSRCVATVDPTGDRSDLWFVAATDRGRCCDGGQLRDPRLLAHHFLVVSGERAVGPWLFREPGGPHAWRAPKTQDTAPRVRCFDNAMDVSLPPPAFTRAPGDEAAAAAEAARAANGTRRFLALHAEGGVSPPEYDLRRALSTAYAPDWWENAADPSFVENPRLLVRKKLGRRDHADALFDARFCLVVEGFAPWTPRLAEAIRAGCVPAILSPTYRPPYSDVLDWTAFAVFLDARDIPRLADVLEEADHARLHANLIKVRRLFSFFADGPAAATSSDPWGPPDGFPLVVFEMWRRFRARRSGGVQYEGRRSSEGSVRVLVGDAQNPARADRAGVAFGCAPDAESCSYTLHGQAWNCSSRTPMACGCVKI